MDTESLISALKDIGSRYPERLREVALQAFAATYCDLLADKSIENIVSAAGLSKGYADQIAQGVAKALKNRAELEQKAKTAGKTVKEYLADQIFTGPRVWPISELPHLYTELCETAFATIDHSLPVEPLRFAGIMGLNRFACCWGGSELSIFVLTPETPERWLLSPRQAVSQFSSGFKFWQRKTGFIFAAYYSRHAPGNFEWLKLAAIAKMLNLEERTLSGAIFDRLHHYNAGNIWQEPVFQRDGTYQMCASASPCSRPARRHTICYDGLHHLYWGQTLSTRGRSALIPFELGHPLRFEERGHFECLGFEFLLNHRVRQGFSMAHSEQSQKISLSGNARYFLTV